MRLRLTSLAIALIVSVASVSYPNEKPLSTVPRNILAALPRLPDDIQYRFLGRHLILRDTRANVILDRIPYAIQRRDCDELTRHR